ncbi:hypothetical protein RDABS01_029311 [Bienertia sinuspersici]
MRPAKRGRGRPRKYDPFNLPEFFKVYLPEHNSKQLLIPPDFVKNFGGKIPKKVTLKNYKGKVWKAELDESESKLLIKKGWECFVIGNSLTRGEFLTFSYEGNAVFNVKIFSISGCKKGETYSQPRVEVSQEQNVDQISSHRTHVGDKMHLEKEVKAEIESQDSTEVVTNCVPERTIESKNMRFTKVFDGNPYEMRIPAAISHKIEPPKLKSHEMILLRSQSGVALKAKFLHRHDRVVLTSGWKEFQLKNNMVKGDECEYEVILDKGRKVKEILLLQIRHRKRALYRNAQLV